MPVFAIALEPVIQSSTVPVIHEMSTSVLLVLGWPRYATNVRSRFNEVVMNSIDFFIEVVPYTALEVSQTGVCLDKTARFE